MEPNRAELPLPGDRQSSLGVKPVCSSMSNRSSIPTSTMQLHPTSSSKRLQLNTFHFPLPVCTRVPTRRVETRVQVQTQGALYSLAQQEKLPAVGPQGLPTPCPRVGRKGRWPAPGTVGRATARPKKFAARHLPALPGTLSQNNEYYSIQGAAGSNDHSTCLCDQRAHLVCVNPVLPVHIHCGL